MPSLQLYLKILERASKKIVKPIESSLLGKKIALINTSPMAFVCGQLDDKISPNISLKLRNKNYLIVPKNF